MKNKNFNWWIIAGIFLIILIIVIVFYYQRPKYIFTKDGVEVDIKFCSNKDIVVKCYETSISLEEYDIRFYIYKESLSIDWFSENCECIQTKDKDGDVVTSTNPQGEIFPVPKHIRENSDFWYCSKYKCGEYEVEIIK